MGGNDARQSWRLEMRQKYSWGKLQEALVDFLKTGSLSVIYFLERALMFLLNSNSDELRKILWQVLYRSDTMVTTVPSALCFWIRYKSWWIRWVYLLLTFIAAGIHTFLLVDQCCFSASSSDSLPDGLFFFFISTARSSSLLRYLPSCFPQGSNSHRLLLAPHSFIPVPVCPSLQAPPALLLLLNPKRCLWRKTLQMPWKMPMSLSSATKSSYATASDLSQRQIFGQLKATFEQVRQLTWRTTCPGHAPSLWQSREGTQSRLPSPAPTFKPLDHVWSVGWFFLQRWSD